MNQPRVQGLFLSGGQSSRMGTDKALLEYAAGSPEVLRWKASFDSLSLPFYWSQRPGQYPDGFLPQIMRVMDQNPASGPLGALLSAHHQDPDAAWLVLACDWPLLGASDIQHLLKQRHPERAATTYLHEGFRQPLFSVYEPGFLRTAAEAWDRGQQSLYRLLHASDAWEVAVLDAGKFLNANDPDQRAQVLTQIRTGLSPHHFRQSDH
ncbi:MAG TPA: NTP transferase domain-containing protein [Oligoflexus sp.]|uniref:molybdenum cofactor guanylyltransferase n=1 Tax=Oligoflexus sp. TaxID=1971216 RepID=UPI002D80255B|nr:NTP transferase domain-containing protein [Oligoflexus sp.]HET9239788.1 NTP transferase domain-containing protein [Oligoflexus sp.]